MRKMKKSGANIWKSGFKQEKTKKCLKNFVCELLINLFSLKLISKL